MVSYVRSHAVAQCVNSPEGFLDSVGRAPNLLSCCHGLCTWVGMQPLGYARFRGTSRRLSLTFFLVQFRVLSPITQEPTRVCGGQAMRLGILNAGSSKAPLNASSFQRRPVLNAMARV